MAPFLLVKTLGGMDQLFQLALLQTVLLFVESQQFDQLDYV